MLGLDRQYPLVGVDRLGMSTCSPGRARHTEEQAFVLWAEREARLPRRPRLLMTAKAAQQLTQTILRLHRVQVGIERAPIAQHGVDRLPGLLVLMATRQPFCVIRADHLTSSAAADGILPLPAGTLREEKD